MTHQVILMAPQRIGPERKASALQSDALTQLIGDGDLIDLQDIGEPESWSHWWRNILATTEQTVLVLVPDGSTLGFRQDQRAERAARMGVSVFILWQPNDANWRLMPLRDVDIRPIESRSLSQFSYVIER